MQKINNLLFFVKLAIMASILSMCKPIDPIDIQPIDDMGDPESELIFHSGFEGSSEIVPTSNSQIDDITGIDNTMSSRNDWKKDFDDHPNIGEFRLYYEGGNTSQRQARIAEEPGNSRNNVLQFWLADNNAGSGKKGRIQADIYKNKGLKEIYQTVRVFFHPDFNQLKTYPARIWWLTIFEAWNNGGWTDQGYPFRVSVNFAKAKSNGSEELYLFAHGQLMDDSDNYVKQWEETNRNVPIPIGQWLTLETYFLEGDYETGRFYMALTPDGGKKQVIFDIRNFTHHPDDPDPQGLSEFNPMKLYAPDEIIDFMQDHDKVLQVYWDNYELWKNRRPDFIVGTNPTPSIATAMPRPF